MKDLKQRCWPRPGAARWVRPEPRGVLLDTNRTCAPCLAAADSLASSSKVQRGLPFGRGDSAQPLCTWGLKWAGRHGDRGCRDKAAVQPVQSHRLALLQRPGAPHKSQSPDSLLSRRPTRFADIYSLIAQSVKNLPAMQETQVQFLCQEDPLEKEMAIHSSILAWKIQWTEEPGGLQSMGSQEADMT